MELESTFKFFVYWHQKKKKLSCSYFVFNHNWIMDHLMVARPSRTEEVHLVFNHSWSHLMRPQTEKCVFVHIHWLSPQHPRMLCIRLMLLFFFFWFDIMLINQLFHHPPIHESSSQCPTNSACHVTVTWLWQTSSLAVEICFVLIYFFPDMET